jgi:hypothetical protein
MGQHSGVKWNITQLEESLQESRKHKEKSTGTHCVPSSNPSSLVFHPMPDLLAVLVAGLETRKIERAADLHRRVLIKVDA